MGFCYSIRELGGIMSDLADVTVMSLLTIWLAFTLKAMYITITRLIRNYPYLNTRQRSYEAIIAIIACILGPWHLLRDLKVMKERKMFFLRI